MAWQLLPVDYTDVVWNGLKKYNQINNSDGTISFQDVTAYTNREKSFFGAMQANRMNEALNTIMSMVENGTDLYEAFSNYFANQKKLFENRGDSLMNTIQTEYRDELTQFEDTQKQLFLTWFDLIKNQLSQDAAGKLQNSLNDLASELKNTTSLSLGEAIAVTVPVDKWVQDSTKTKYTQTVSVPNMKTTYDVLLLRVPPTDSTTLAKYNKDFAIISQGTGTTGNNSVTLTVLKKPQNTITIALKIISTGGV